MQPSAIRPLARSLAAGALLLASSASASAADARIEVDAGRPGAPVSRRLFGKFTEHLGRNIYGGMWSQTVRNPGFERWTHFGSREAQREASHPAGCAAHWLPLEAGTAAFTLEPDAWVAGQTCQAVAATAIEPGREAGLRQDDLFLPLHRESDYLLSFAARAEGEPRFAVSLRRGKEVLARAAFDPPGAAWTKRSASLVVPGARALAGQPLAGQPLALAVEVLSPGKLFLDQLELFPADHLEGFDRDVVRLEREAGLPLLRWPGGNFASGYHWRDGIGPRETRPIRRNPAWDMVEYNHVGTDEFLAFARLVGCEPLICVNAGDGTPEEAAAWVEYVNGPVFSPLGALRARHGHPEPYKVRLWEVGNELYGDWQIGHATAGEYAERYLRFAKAMRAADPGLFLIANGNDAAWNRTVLERDGAEVRSLSVHPLIGGGTPAEADPEKVFRALLAYATTFERDVREQAEWAGARGLHPRVAVTELQIFTNRRGLPTNGTLSEALFLGRFIHAAMRLEGAVEMITHSALVNHGGGLGKRREVVFPQPVQHAHRLYGTLAGSRPVPVAVTCGTYSASEPRIPAAAGAPDLDAIALLDGTGRELSLVVINTHPREEVVAAVAVTPAGARAVRARRVDGPSYLTENSPEAPDAAGLRTIEPPLAGEGRFRFPPHSITEVVLGW